MRTFSPGAFADVMISRPHLSSATTMDEAVKSRDTVAWIGRWPADESGYVDLAWPVLKKAIEESRTSNRKRFRSSPWSRAWAAIRNWFAK
jgi:hypothetical protein